MPSTNIVFLRVKPPHTETLVDYLAGYPVVTSAAGVYSKSVDVIAVTSGDERAWQEVIDASPEPFRPKCHAADERIGGPSRARGRHHNLFAFLQLKVRAGANRFQNVLKRLTDIPEVRFIYPMRSNSEIFVQIAAMEKDAFDKAVMTHIQKPQGTVLSTATHFCINNMQWADDGIPFDRDEFRNRDIPVKHTPKSFPVFMSLAEADGSEGQKLSARILDDSGIRVWNFLDELPDGGTTEFQKEIEAAIDNAELYIFLESYASKKSEPCKEEREKIKKEAKLGQICYLVVPPMQINELSEDLKNNYWCLDGNPILAYPKLLDWLRGEL